MPSADTSIASKSSRKWFRYDFLCSTSSCQKGSPNSNRKSSDSCFCMFLFYTCRSSCTKIEQLLDSNLTVILAGLQCCINLGWLLRNAARQKAIRRDSLQCWTTLLVTVSWSSLILHLWAVQPCSSTKCLDDVCQNPKLKCFCVDGNLTNYIFDTEWQVKSDDFICPKDSTKYKNQSWTNHPPLLQRIEDTSYNVDHSKESLQQRLGNPRSPAPKTAQYTCPKTSLLPRRKCDVQDKENTWHFTTRHCLQGFVENPPVLATSHGHVQGEDGHIQGTKIFQQGRVCWILSAFKCVQEVHNARGKGDAKPEEHSNAKWVWNAL